MTPRVVFVDDEPAVLAGMRDRLRRHRGRWEMAFWSSPIEAIGDLEAHGADVIVSDVRMPKMNGAELLGRARQLCPAATRIALTGQTDAATALELHLVAHQFLGKPCDVDRIVDLVERRSRLGQMVPAGAIALATSAPEVPASPTTYRELEKVFARASWTIDDAAEVVERDEVAALQLLRIASSPYFGARPVRSVRDALSLLGAKAVQRIVLGLNAQGGFSAVARTTLAGHTHHALVVAERAASLARPERRSDAYLGGMLHDIGGLVIAATHPEEHREILAHAGKDERRMVARETEVLGFDHADVGAALLAVWGLPCELVEAVLLHHRAGGSELAAWVREAGAEPTSSADRGAPT